MNYLQFDSAKANGFESDPRCACPACGEGANFAEEICETFEALERSRVLGVLDAFVSRHALIACHVVVFGSVGGQAMHMCEFRTADGLVLEWRGGDKPDDARAAAAKAIAAGEVA